MTELVPVVGLVLGVLVVNGLSSRASLPAPILLVIAGIAVSFVPGIPEFRVDPDVVLAALLPPLLFGAALESSAVALRRLLRPILQLSVGLVVLTALVVALALRLVLPGLPFAAALALGAIVAPPDAVAAVAVARRVGLPQRLVTVLEGESLFNDATSLVLLRVSVAAVGGSSLAFGPALGDFAWAAGGGLLVGAALGLAVSAVRRRLDSPLASTALSLVSPFAAYAAGEAAHASGVLAVVVTGLVLGFRNPVEVPASVRLTDDATWAALRYVLEGAVFALIGLQLRGVVAGLDTSIDSVVEAVAVVLAVVIVSRPLLILLINAVSRVTPGPSGAWPLRGVGAVSWAGMRGVVSLAAAQTLPLATPYRSLLLVCTVAVIFGTLVVQGLTLPWLIRRLGLAVDDRADVERERAQAFAAAAEAVAMRVDELAEGGRLPERQAAQMRRWAELRDWRNWSDGGASEEFGRRLSAVAEWRRDLLAIERTAIVGLRNEGTLSEAVLRAVQHELDLEEALLERRSQAVDGHLEELPGADDPNGVDEAETEAGEPSGRGSDSSDAGVQLPDANALLFVEPPVQVRSGAEEQDADDADDAVQGRRR